MTIELRSGHFWSIISKQTSLSVLNVLDDFGIFLHSINLYLLHEMEEHFITKLYNIKFSYIMGSELTYVHAWGTITMYHENEHD